MYIPRFLEKELRKYLTKREILAVVGPRQSGKTTLLRRLFEKLPHAHFLDFEDRETLELFNEDIASFAELYVKKYDFLFIDEFQYAREGGKKLKYLYDTYKTKLVISGSSVSGLAIESIQYLVGRVFVFHLYPFSFEEYLAFKDPDLYPLAYATKPLTRPLIAKILPHFNEFSIFGGYPRVLLAEEKEEKEIVLRNIYNTYFLKEIREILKLPDDYRLSKLITALALQVGNILNYKELSDLTGFSYKELLHYLNVLEKTFICLRIPPFYTNKRTELVKTPKIFFFDNGFRNTILKNFQPLAARQDKGLLYENFVASELIKLDIQFKYWRTKAKAEVDFVIEKNGQAIPIEVKSSLPKPKLSPSFGSFLTKHTPSFSFILSEQLFAEHENVRFRPIFSLSKELRALH